MSEPEQAIEVRESESNGTGDLDFLLEEYKQLLSLRDTAMSISMNRMNVFFAFASVSSVAIALLIGRQSVSLPMALGFSSLVLLALLLLGVTSFIALCEHHISRVFYLRGANLLRGELATRLGVVHLMRLPVTEKNPTIYGTGHFHGPVSVLISFPTILALMNGFTASIVAGILSQDAGGGLGANLTVGAIVLVAFVLGGLFYESRRFKNADLKYDELTRTESTLLE